MPLPGIALAKCEEKHTDVQVINSRAADEMLNIKGVKASFVVGENDEGITVISARSLGDVNVQTIMEKLGGGGNLTKAGAQIEIPVDETMDLIVELVRELEYK
jgi:c-di-AMP phosphodiesterase-like protein